MSVLYFGKLINVNCIGLECMETPSSSPPVKPINQMILIELIQFGVTTIIKGHLQHVLNACVVHVLNIWLRIKHVGFHVKLDIHYIDPGH